MLQHRTRHRTTHIDKCGVHSGGGRNLIAKTYEVPDNFDVQKLAEADFQDRGMLYTHRDTVKIRDNQTEETKQASQMVSIDHEEKKRSYE